MCPREAERVRSLSGMTPTHRGHAAHRRRALGESVERIQPDLIIPTGKRKGHSPSVASIYRALAEHEKARRIPKPSRPRRPTSPRCASDRQPRPPAPGGAATHRSVPPQGPSGAAPGLGADFVVGGTAERLAGGEDFAHVVSGGRVAVLRAWRPWAGVGRFRCTSRAGLRVQFLNPLRTRAGVSLFGSAGFSQGLWRSVASGRASRSWA
jgi:hypothetical protein